MQVDMYGALVNFGRAWSGMPSDLVVLTSLLMVTVLVHLVFRGVDAGQRSDGSELPVS